MYLATSAKALCAETYGWIFGISPLDELADLHIRWARLARAYIVFVEQRLPENLRCAGPPTGIVSELAIDIVSPFLQSLRAGYPQ